MGGLISNLANVSTQIAGGYAVGKQEIFEKQQAEEMRKRLMALEQKNRLEVVNLQGAISSDLQNQRFDYQTRADELKNKQQLLRDKQQHARAIELEKLKGKQKIALKKITSGDTVTLEKGRTKRFEQQLKEQKYQFEENQKLLRERLGWNKEKWKQQYELYVKTFERDKYFKEQTLKYQKMLLDIQRDNTLTQEAKINLTNEVGQRKTQLSALSFAYTASVNLSRQYQLGLKNALQAKNQQAIKFYSARIAAEDLKRKTILGKLFYLSNKPYTSLGQHKYDITTPPSNITISPNSSYFSYKNINKYDNFITKYAKQYGIKPIVLKALIVQESSFNPASVSRVGAFGLTQFLPSTWADVSKKTNLADKNNVEHQIANGAFYLGSLLKRYNGDYRLALAAYNGGMGALDRMGRDISKMPYETREYVRRILGEHVPGMLKGLRLQRPEETPPTSEMAGVLSLAEKYKIPDVMRKKYNKNCCAASVTDVLQKYGLKIHGVLKNPAYVPNWLKLVSSGHATKITDQSQFKPGDILLMRKDPRDGLYGHIGIYAGNNQMWHAGSSGGVSWRKSKLYYSDAIALRLNTSKFSRYPDKTTKIERGIEPTALPKIGNFSPEVVGIAKKVYDKLISGKVYQDTAANYLAKVNRDSLRASDKKTIIATIISKVKFSELVNSIMKDHGVSHDTAMKVARAMARMPLALEEQRKQQERIQKERERRKKELERKQRIEQGRGSRLIPSGPLL